MLVELVNYSRPTRTNCTKIKVKKRMMMIANLLLKLERNVKQFCFEVAPERCK